MRPAAASAPAFSSLDGKHPSGSTVRAIHTVRKPVASVAVCGSWVFAGLHNGVIHARRATSSAAASEDEDRSEFAAHTGVVRKMIAIPGATADTVTLFTCSSDGTAKKWQFPGAAWQMTFQGHDGSVETLCTLPHDATAVATGGADGTLRLWHADTGHCTTSIRCHSGRVTAIAAVSKPPPPAEGSGAVPDDSPEPPAHCVVTASDDGLARLVDYKAKSTLALFSNDGVPVFAACYVHPVVYIAGSDAKIRGFSVYTAAPVRTLSGHKDAISGLCTFGGELYSVADDKRLLMWDVATWGPKYEFTGHTQCISAVSVDQHGELATCSFDGSVRVWDRAGVVEQFRRAAQLAAEEAAAKRQREIELAKEAEAKAKAKKSSADAKKKGKK